MNGSDTASAETIARRATACGWSVATAESLTSGALSSALGAASDASQWFRGAIVAYSTDVKHRLLEVGPGPVVSAACAQQMARATAHLLGADAVVATTGAGGPDPQDGRPPGTVYIAIRTPVLETVSEHYFDGSPESVVNETVRNALTLLARHLPDSALRR